MEDWWIPRRPWGLQVRGDRVVIGAVDQSGEVMEAVCFLEYDDSTQKPLKMARAQFIVDAVNAR